MTFCVGVHQPLRLSSLRARLREREPAPAWVASRLCGNGVVSAAVQPILDILPAP
jgi:hypothetical protein